MAIEVDIADRLYDYTDEEKAAEALALFQATYDLGDQATLALWANKNDPLRAELEKQILQAIDANGSARRALESVPAEIYLAVQEASA